MERTRLDRRGIFSFLSITFFITYAIEGALILSGFRITRLPAMYGQLVVAAVMWVPALATVLTIRFITREGFAIVNFRFGSWKPYVASGLIVPLCFVLIYGLTWLLGIGRPHWEVDQYMATLRQAGGANIPHMPSPAIILPAMYMATLVMAPFLNGLFGFGEELGWRGYLLPKLMVLGKPRAYVLLGIVWGLWHLPLILIGFTYPGHPVLGVVAFVAVTITLGIYINELTLRHRSSILAGWVHGVFNSQKLGVWAMLFPTVNPLIGGFAGIVGIVVWLLLGLWEMRRPRRTLFEGRRS
ncbi:MAG TPA: CPBP family intramembrane glutamic endopeptidase [Candidatus Krumholzibacteriaceae bacterium]